MELRGGDEAFSHFLLGATSGMFSPFNPFEFHLFTYLSVHCKTKKAEKTVLVNKK